MATEDARYRQSSQYRLWSFSPSQLADLRAKTNALAKASISERLSSPKSSAPSSGANTPQPSVSDTHAGAKELPEFLTPAEEELLLKYFTWELLTRATEFLKWTADIKATAAVLFRRFYVTNSIMTYPPKEIMKTALFFGAKAEGHYQKLSTYGIYWSVTLAAGC